jgi:tetratricopeptide (TPR) repeat protein
MHMKFAKGRVCCFTDQEKLGADIKNFLVLASKQGDLRVELAGHGPSDLWFILTGLDEPALSASLSRISLFGPLKKSGIQQVFIHNFNDTLDAASPDASAPVPNALSEQVTSTEETASVLGMPLFSEALLADIEGRFSCRGMKRVLLSCHRECKGVQCAVAFAVIPRAVIERLPESSDCFDNVYTARDGNCVLFMKKASRRERPGFDIQAWARNIQEVAVSYGKGSAMPALPLGVAASWQQTLKSSIATGAAFWAYVHAFMLGSGKAIVFDAVTWQVRGDELIASGALRDACRAFRNALKLDGSNAEIWNSLGVCLAQLGRKREAEKAFIAASRRDPDDFMTFYNLCGVQHALKNYDQAEASCRRSLELRSGDPMILMRLGQVLLDSGRAADAVKYLRQAETANESPTQAVLRLLGIAFYRLNEWPKAKQALKRAVKLKPDDVISRAYLALGYAEFDNDHATARRLAQNITQKSQSSQELRRISARLGAFLAESSLDKE